jgi:hypothetical protein
MIHSIGAKVRHIILHYHVFKNGGVVIDRCLDKNFGDGLAHINGQDPNSTISNAELLQFLRAHQDVNAVSSYHLRPPRPEVDDFVFLDVVFLRHPLDRICVIFEDYRRVNNPADLLADLAKTKGLGSFVEQLLVAYPHFINNAQVNYLANGGRYFRPPKKSDLCVAVQRIEQAALPGLAHLFEISLATAEYFFHPAFPNIELSYVTPNPLSSGTACQQRLDCLKKLCASATYDRLVEMNQLDLELVRLAQQEVNRRFRLIPEAEQRLANLLERCRKASEYFLEYDDVDG